MRRRTLLATTGTVLSAGCSGILPAPDDAPTATDGPATDSAVPTPTDAGPDSPTGPDRTTDPAETTEANTETPHPRADEVIAAARSDLTSAYTTYVAFAGESATTLLDVDAAIDVSVGGVREHVSAARSDLDDAPRGANDPQKATIDALGGVATLLDRGIQCQVELHNAYESFAFVLDRIYAQQLPRVPNRIDQLRQEHGLAQGHYDVVRAETDRTDVESFEPVTKTGYDAKIAQFERELAAFGALPGPLTAVRDGLKAFIEASRRYDSEDYLDALQRYPTAIDELGVAADGLDAVARPDSMATQLENLTSVTKALAAASVDLEAAARAGDEGRRSDREDAFAAAKVHLRSSQVAVERLDIVDELLE